MAIHLHPTLGVNPKLTYCPRCGGESNELVLIGDRTAKMQCQDCNTLNLCATNLLTCMRTKVMFIGGYYCGWRLEVPQPFLPRIVLKLPPTPQEVVSGAPPSVQTVRQIGYDLTYYGHLFQVVYYYKAEGCSITQAYARILGYVPLREGKTVADAKLLQKGWDWESILAVLKDKDIFGNSISFEQFSGDVT